MSGEKSIGKGACHALFAYDIGVAIRLDDAQVAFSAVAQRGGLPAGPRAGEYFELRPQPLRVALRAPAVALGSFATAEGIEIVLYDFGAVSVNYRVPFEGGFGQLRDLSEALFENRALLADSRRHVEWLLEVLGPAVERPGVLPQVEDYVVMHVAEPAIERAWAGAEHAMAQVLRAERRSLAPDEVKDATGCAIAFAPDDQALIDWNAALLFGPGLDDTRAVLEFANVELLEMRVLDSQLDRALDQAYAVLSRGRVPMLRLPVVLERDAAAIARLQVDSAVLFERVTNSVKLLGDQYLARVYRLASQRFHLPSWDAAIRRKLETLGSIYAKLNDRIAARRMELLEIVIIALIAVEVIRALW